MYMFVAHFLKAIKKIFIFMFWQLVHCHTTKKYCKSVIRASPKFIKAQDKIIFDVVMFHFFFFAHLFII